MVYNDTLSGLVSRMEELAQQYRSFWQSLGARVNPGRFLDVGCSTGHLLRIGADFGWQVYGVDYSRINIRYGQEKLGLNNLRLSDLHNACYPDDFFDYVHLWHVLEHARNPASQLEEIRRILKPGKELLVGVPCITDPIYYALRFKSRLMGCPPPISSDNAHTFEFTSSTLKEMLKKTGFYVQNIRVYYNPLESLLPESDWRGKALMTFLWYLAKVLPNRFGHRIEAHAIKTETDWPDSTHDSWPFSAEAGNFFLHNGDFCIGFSIRRAGGYYPHSSPPLHARILENRVFELCSFSFFRSCLP